MDALHPAERRNRDPHQPIAVDLRDHLLAAAEQAERARGHQEFLARAGAVLCDLGAIAKEALASCRRSGRTA